MAKPLLEQQFIEAYEQLADGIFRYCYFKLSDRERAKDIMQETFTKGWQFAASGKEIKNLKAFLYRTANNLIIDEYRRKAHRRTESLDHLQEQGFIMVDPNTEQSVNSAEVGFALKLIKKLDSKYAEVIVMRFLDDLSPKEIAEILGESENTISVRIHRGLKKIKTLTNEQID